MLELEKNMGLRNVKVKGASQYKLGTQKQRILQYYWGTGSTVTNKSLVSRYKIMKPTARICELRQDGFDIRSLRFVTRDTKRSAVKYRIMQRKVA